MKVKLKDPKRVYYCKEQKLSFAGKEVIETKVTQHVRGLINDGALVEVPELSAEEKKAIVAEAKADAAKVEAERVEKLTPAEKAAETKAKKEAAAKTAKEKEEA